jgi:Uma2 family endonuclease
MNIALRRDLTVPEYLAWAEAQSGRKRTQLIDGQIVQMPSELVVHTRLKIRAYMALQAALAVSGLEGEVLTDGVAVPIDGNSAYEPDALLYLGPPVAGQQMTAPEPVVVVEVLSPTTAHLDKGVKLAGYFALPSVQHYLIIDPVTASLVHHGRSPDGSIVASTHSAGTLRLDPPGLVISVDQIFGGP